MIVQLKKHAVSIIHVLSWILLGYMLFIYHPMQWEYRLPLLFWVEKTIMFSLLVGLYYLNTEVLIPKFMFREQLDKYVLALALVLLVQIFLGRIADRMVFKDVVLNQRFELDLTNWKAAATQLNPFNKFGYFDKTFPMLDSILIALGLILSFNKKWQKDKLARENLEREKLTSELLYLKAQINPHFFFNTLNNIYSFTLTDGDAARKSITNLSKMMRYVLYDSRSPFTDLEREVAFLQEYIDLMRIRLTENIRVTANFTDYNPQTPVAAMLFLPFVENAFKHGVSTVDDGYIEISLKQVDHWIELRVKNKVFGPQQRLDLSNGIGLPNTRRRLDLLYPGKYILNVVQKDSRFEVKLKLDTA